MRNTKKGAIEISFGWIFMIMIGVVFILLAYNIVGKYSQIQQDKYLVQLKQTIKDVLVNSGNTNGQAENALVPLGNLFQSTSVSLQCVDGITLLDINGNLDSNNQYLQNNPVFMTSIKQGTIPNSYMAIESYKMPFKISNLLALISTKNLIVFDSNAQISKDFLKKFSQSSYNYPNLNYISYDFNNLKDPQNFISSIDNQNLNSIVFVSDSNIPSSILKAITQKTNIYTESVAITGQHYGDIKYVLSDGQTQSFPYVDSTGTLSLQTMALFSTPSIFNCSYNQIVNQSVPVYNFYLSKTKFFLDYYNNLISSPNPNNDIMCSNMGIAPTTFQGYYNQSYQDLTKIKQMVQQSGFKDNSKIYSYLRNLNQNFIYLENYNCQYIY